MALDLILLAVAAFVVSAAIAYAWWADVRVTFLREELFAIRDELWDVARERSSLSDDAHSHARKHLNAIIRTAGLYSVPTLEIMVRRGRDLPSERRPVPRDPVLRKAIDEAYQKSWEVLCRHIFLRHVSGWIAAIRVLASYWRNGQRPFVEAINRRPQQREQSKWVMSSRPEVLSEIDSESRGCGALTH